MSMVSIGYQEYQGRKQLCYVDTDDLDQLSYYYYCRAKSISRKHSKAGVIASRILRGRLTGEDIEQDKDRYSFLTDEAQYMMLKIACEEN